MRRRLLPVAAVVALVAAGSVAWRVRSEPGVRMIEIAIHHSRFQPSRVIVQPGETVRFVLRNTDPIDHEFILGDRTVQRIHEGGTEAHHGDKPGEISIPAGTARSTIYTFGERGPLFFGCHLPGHYAYGMRGTVTIA